MNFKNGDFCVLINGTGNIYKVIETNLTEKDTRKYLSLSINDLTININDLLILEDLDTRSYCWGLKNDNINITSKLGKLLYGQKKI